MDHLSVRIVDATTDRHVTQHATGLTYTKTAPGGWSHGAIHLDLDRPTEYPTLGSGDRLHVYDNETGAEVFTGFCENPGDDGPAGFNLGIQGPMVLAADMSAPLTYVARGVENDQWRRYLNISPGATDSITADPAGLYPDIAALLLQFPAGQPVGPGSSVTMIRQSLYDQSIHHLLVTTFAGIASTDWLLIGYRVTSSGDLVAVVNSYAPGTTPVDLTANMAGADAPGIALRFARTGPATNITGDDGWAFFNVLIRAYMTDARGVPIAGRWTDAVSPDEVVGDIAWRLLPGIDHDRATITPYEHRITYLAWPDGIHPTTAFAHLATLGIDATWGIGASGPGGHDFWWGPWPSEPRYEISTETDEYEESNSVIELCNRVQVWWTDSPGRKHRWLVTADVPELRGRTHDADPITLPEGQGSAENAQAAGEKALAEKNQMSRSASARVRRQVRDLLTGSWVNPWLIEPGNLVWVREHGRAMRLTEVTYTADDNTAALKLGDPVL